MHPAPSIIVFTTLSGLGFGMMAWIGLGAGEAEGWLAALYCLIALGLAGIGLLASLGHLGNPQRAWRALSQWRSSWLSREGVVSIAAMAVFFLYAVLWAVWGDRIAPLGWLAALLALGTILCTSMIYAQLKTVPRWNHWSTPALFFLYGLGGGALLAGLTWVALVLLAGAGAMQVWAWQRGDGAYAASGSTIETATGLGRIGRTRLLEAPHSAPNYLMKEMVFVVGRRRAVEIRRWALALGAVLPVVLLLVAVIYPGLWPLALGLAAVSYLVGVLAARWLFFAEAEHVVGLYYGRTAA